MLEQSINIVIALVLGLVTGFYFERRGRKIAQSQLAASVEDNERLRLTIEELEAEIVSQREALTKQVMHVQESVYSSATSSNSESQSGHRSDSGQLDGSSLVAILRQRIGADGKTPLSTLRGQLLLQGHSRESVDSVVDALADAGTIRIDGKSVELL